MKMLLLFTMVVLFSFVFGHSATDAPSYSTSVYTHVAAGVTEPVAISNSGDSIFNLTDQSLSPSSEAIGVKATSAWRSSTWLSTNGLSIYELISTDVIRDSLVSMPPSEAKPNCPSVIPTVGYLRNGQFMTKPSKAEHGLCKNRYTRHVSITV